MNSWINMPENTEDYFGFVYLIRNIDKDILQHNIDIINGKSDKKIIPIYYIGCKQLLKKTILKPTKTRKKNKVVWRDNGVNDYWGSSKELLYDIQRFGVNSFTREVIEMSNSKFHMKYREIKWQLACNALFDDKFYNGILNCRLSKPKSLVVDNPINPAILNLI
jgi:hypothetical protein